MKATAQIWFYRALGVGVLVILAMALVAHFNRVQALIAGEAVAASPWVEVCTPAGIERVPVRDLP